MKHAKGSMKHARKSKMSLPKMIKPEVLFVLFAAIFLGIILFTRPYIGMADNGDFFRVLQPMKLYYLPENYETRYFAYFNRLYGIARYRIDTVENFVSTQLVPVKLSVWLNRLFIHNYLFDIRFLAFIYSVLFLTTAYLIMKYYLPEGKAQNTFFILLSLLIFLDIGYICYFNSFYGEPVSLIFTLMTLASTTMLLTYKGRSLWPLVFYVFSSCMLIGAKQQNSPLGVPLAVMCIRCIYLRKGHWWKTAVATSTLILILASVVIFTSISPEIARINQYHTITLGVLKDSEDPGNDLEELGIDRKFALLKGTNYYDPYPIIVPDSPVMIKEFYNKYSFTKIVVFYIRHFDRFLKKLDIVAANSFTIRPSSYGNYEKTEGKLPGQKINTFSLWSTFKEMYMPHTLRFVVFFYFSFIVGSTIIYVFDKDSLKRAGIEALWLIAIFGIIQFLTAFIGAGEADLAKHLFLFNVCFDVMFTAVLVFLSTPVINLAASKLKISNF